MEAALVELLRVRMAVAFVHDSWVRPGVGDTLISRIRPFLPPLPIMLVSEDGPNRAYAPFQTPEFLNLLLEVQVQRFEIDLSEEPEDEEELPF